MGAAARCARAPARPLTHRPQRVPPSPLFPPAVLVNVFETFLPQLLLYPNASDPLNGEAAALHMRDPPAYIRKVKGEQGLYCAAPVLCECQGFYH